MKKKISIFIVSIMLIVSCLVGLTACGNPSTTTSIQTYGLLGEPAVTGAVANGSKISFDLQQLYKESTSTDTNPQGYGYPQAVVIVNENFLSNHKDVVSKVLFMMQNNITFISENSTSITNILSKNTYGSPSASKFPPKAISKCGVNVQLTKDAKDETIKLLNNVGIPKINEGFFAEVEANNTTSLSTNKLTIAVPDGAPALSVANIVKNGIEGISDLTLDINKPELIKDAVASNKVDMAILPSNLSYKLFDASTKKDGVAYKMVATATYGNLYIVGEDTPNDIQKLKGSIVYSIGENAIPHKVLETVLKHNNLEINIIKEASEASNNKVNVIFKEDGFNVLGELKKNK